MAYTKQQWVDNTTPVDAAHMNHIEDGIGDIDISNILNTQNRIGSVFNNTERNIDNYNNDNYSGVWWANGAGTAVTGTFPGTAKVGILIIKRHSPQYLYQYFLDINALAFYRYYDKNSSTWIDWRETQATTIIQNTNTLGAAQRFGFVALTSGQELNTLTNVGVYSANTNAIAQSVIPSPFDASFKLIVEKMQSNSNNYTVQTAIKVGTYEIARRITLNNGTTWTDWVKQPTREEVDSLVDAGTLKTASVAVSIGTYTGTITARKRYGMVTLPLSIGGANIFNNAESNVQIATLPEGFRPSYTVTIPAIMRSAGTWATADYINVSININTSGVVTLVGNSAQIKTMLYLTGQIVFAAA